MGSSCRPVSPSRCCSADRSHTPPTLLPQRPDFLPERDGPNHPAQAAPRSDAACRRTACGSDTPRVRIQPLIEGYFALRETFRFSVRTIQRMLKRLANRARISRTVSPRVLRHTFAVTAIQKGISLAALQRLLGHDSLLTTEIYLNLSPEHVVEEFQQKW